MGFFDRIVNIIKAQVNSVDDSTKTGKASVKMPVKTVEKPMTTPLNVARNENCVKLLSLEDKLGRLLSEKKYIAKSDYRDLVKEYSSVVDFFDVLAGSGIWIKIVHMYK